MEFFSVQMEQLLECFRTLVNSLAMQAMNYKDLNNGTCLANQSWSGGDPICVALNCSTSPPLRPGKLDSLFPISARMGFNTTASTFIIVFLQVLMSFLHNFSVLWQITVAIMNNEK